VFTFRPVPRPRTAAPPRIQVFEAAEPVPLEGLGAVPLKVVIRVAEALGPEHHRRAEVLATAATAHAADLRARVLAHYRHAQAEGWLEFWGVPADLPDAEVLARIAPVLQVGPTLVDSLAVHPAWEREHGLSFELHDGAWVQE
jgi:hypothetical protein